jgi:regulator of cell morphogenesis and NO signaling
MAAEVKIKPIEELKDEHQSVLKLLAEMGSIMGSAHELSQEQWQGFLQKACAFFRKDVALHFKKEEDALFPAMGKRLGHGSGPIAVMLSEHEQHNQLLGRLCGAVGAADLKTTREVWADFNPLLTMHIMKEDNILFPMAANILGAAEWTAVGEKMAALNAEI